MVKDIGRVRPNKQRNGSIRYYIDFRPICRIWGRPGEGAFADERDAERVRDVILESVRRNKIPLEQAVAPYLPSKAKPLLVPVRMKAWIKEKTAETDAGDLSPTYLRILKQYAKPTDVFSWWANKSIHEITSANLHDFNAWLRDERKLSQKSRFNILGALRSFTRWLKEIRAEIKEVPKFPKVKVDERAPTVVTPQEQAAILSQIEDNAVGVFLAMATLGIRPNEVVALRVCDYTLELNPQTGQKEPWIYVKKAAKGATLDAPIRSPKTSRYRRLPVPRLLAEWHERQPIGLHPDLPLYRNPDKQAKHPQRRWGYQALIKRWTRAARRAGVSVGLYQGTKHTIATEILDRCGNIKAVQDLLGHVDIRSTLKYAKLRDRALREIVDLPDPFERQVSAKPKSKKAE